MSLPKILVVDDDKNLLELLKIRLESANYEVVAVLREENAVNEMKNQVFDLAIIRPPVVQDGWHIADGRVAVDKS